MNQSPQREEENFHQSVGKKIPTVLLILFLHHATPADKLGRILLSLSLSLRKTSPIPILTTTTYCTRSILYRGTCTCNGGGTAGRASGGEGEELREKVICKKRRRMEGLGILYYSAPGSFSVGGYPLSAFDRRQSTGRNFGNDLTLHPRTLLAPWDTTTQRRDDLLLVKARGPRLLYWCIGRLRTVLSLSSWNAVLLGSPPSPIVIVCV